MRRRAFNSELRRPLLTSTTSITWAPAKIRAVAQTRWGKTQQQGLQKRFGSLVASRLRCWSAVRSRLGGQV